MLKKLPLNIQAEGGIVDWMRFFKGKNKEEFRRMAETNIYLSEAYEALLRLSADEKKRLEYEARGKTLKDYNTQMSCAQKRSERLGERHGIKKGIELACKVLRLQLQSLSVEAIAPQCGISVEEVQEILALQQH